MIDRRKVIRIGIRYYYSNTYTLLYKSGASLKSGRVQ